MKRRGDIPRVTTQLAVLLALFIAVVPPAAWLAHSYDSLRDTLRIRAEITARRVTGFIAENPRLWRHDEIHLGSFLGIDATRQVPERRRVFDAKGNLVAKRDAPLSWPVLTEESPVWDAGTPAGRVEVGRSLYPGLRGAAVVGLTSTLIGGGALVIFLLYPMSALRRALSSLSEEKERAQVTLQSIGEGVIASDTAGNVLLMNHVAESLTGWTRKEAAGKPLRDVFRLRGGESSRFTSGEIAPKGPLSLLAESGEERLIEATGAPIRDRQGGIQGTILVFRDVTEKVRTEEELLLGRKLESLGILAGGIAHDFNNLLVGIIGNISLAKEMVDPEKRVHQRLAEAERASAKAKELAARLLAFSKGGKPIRREISVPEAVRDAAVLATRGTRCRCEFQVQEGLWAAFADAGQIGQVINNLAINAVQAMPSGGTIRLSMENLPVRDGEIPHVKAGRYVKVVVADEGTGIPAEILPKIFDPYFTTKEKGSGLGLTTCYSILKSHGGNIFAQSAPGAGTSFHLYIPATGEAAREESPEREQAVMPGTGRVLLMDDEEMVLEVAGEMLAHLGYQGSPARNGGEAVAIYAREEGAFDAAILDLTVPGGMGGKEAASLILGRYPSARLIVSSGYSDDPVMASPGEYGFAGVVAKPYKIADLSRVLRQVLGREGSAAPAATPDAFPAEVTSRPA